MKSHLPDAIIRHMQENLQTFSSKVYTCLAGALGLSALVAWITSHTPLLAYALNPVVIGIAVVVEIILVIWLSRASKKLSPASALVGLGVYAALNGFTLAYIFLYYDLSSIATTFVGCAFFFLLLGAVGHTTAIDLSKFSSIFFIGLAVSLIVGIVNIFLGSPTLDLIIDVFGVLVFMGLTLYDQQKIKQISDTGIDCERLVVPMALEVYLDFVNLFLRLLQIFGRRRD